MAIDWITTFRKTGKTKFDLEKYPKSNQRVYKVCDQCGAKEQIKYKQDHDLCKKCLKTARNV